MTPQQQGITTPLTFFTSSSLLQCYCLLRQRKYSLNFNRSKMLFESCPIDLRPVNNHCGGHGYSSCFRTIFLILVVLITCWFTLPSYISSFTVLRLLRSQRFFFSTEATKKPPLTVSYKVTKAWFLKSRSP